MSNILINECTDEILIKEQWYNLISGKEVDNKIIPGFILESWKRSLKNQINPSSLNDVLLTKNEVENEIKKLEGLVLEFGDIINVIRELSRNKNWSIQIFDNKCKNLYCIRDNFNRDLSKLIASNVSEEKIGTNSISIAIKEKKPVQIRGPEHYNELLHDVYCSAAPIFNKEKELVAVINIASINKKHNKETISLVTSFAKVFTNKLIIKEMNKELRVYNNTLNKIIKYYPEGILFIDSNNKIKNYNDKLLEILEIEDKEIEDEKNP